MFYEMKMLKIAAPESLEVDTLYELVMLQTRNK